MSMSMPDIKNFAHGDIIIEEDTKGEEVFTMLSGKAEVYVRDTKVGEISDSETFGAISVLTGMPRTATVKANGSCTVVTTKGESYMKLIMAEPERVKKLVEDIARLIVSTNDKVVELSKKKNLKT